METPSSPPAVVPISGSNHLRFHLPHSHLAPVFGSDWFALKAEAFARFFGTPVFLVSQTVVVTIWIVMNVIAITSKWRFDEYPFILLNLFLTVVSTMQSPIIMMSQNRQVERDRDAVSGLHAKLDQLLENK